MITFLCWYFGISVLYTSLYYLILTSDKVFSLLLEHGKDEQFSAYLLQRNYLLYIPVTTITLNILIFPVNFVLKTLSVITKIVGKYFVTFFGKQEEIFRLKKGNNK